MQSTFAVRCRSLGRAVAIMALCGGSAGAQVSAPQISGPLQAPASGPSGGVSGTVFVQDSQRPARFVDVLLQSVASASGQAQVRDNPFSNPGGAQGRTDVDGTFTLTGVAPGDYYVMAGGPGFIPERSLLQAAVASGADPNDLLGRIPTVHVVADSTSSVTVNLQRGGALSGRVLWEDGSPAAGIPISVVLNGTAATLPASLQAIRSPGGSASSATTDDRGIFRIAGMAPADYLVEAVIQSRPQFGGFDRREAQNISTIRDYAPGTFHKANAKPVTVRVGEERDDVNITVDLRGLHTVAGHASSASGGANVASGRVSLIDPTDPALILSGSIQSDGSFSVRYVPPGIYTLQIAGASTQASGGFGGRRGGGSGSGGTSFQPFSGAVTVTDGDLTGVAAMLTPVQTSP
jgi:hypothetical protein